MISCLFMTGRIGEPLSKNLRYIEIDRSTPDLNHYKIDKFRLKYWASGDNSLLMKLKTGTLVSIKGRIENDEEMGIVIVVERLETIADLLAIEKIKNKEN